MRDVTRLVQQATSQQGLLTSRQADDLDLSGHVLRRLCDRGFLVRVQRGLYRLASHPETWAQRLAGACLVPDPPAAGSHRSSLRLWSLRSFDEEIEVTVRYPRRLSLPGVIVHRSVDLESDDVTWVDGIPTTTPIRTLCDSGLIFPEHEVRRLVDHAVATGLVTVADLWRFRHRVGVQGRNGVGVLHSVLASLPDSAATAESSLEVAFLRLCAERGLPTPSPQHPVVVAGARFRIDAAYSEQRVAIELDGFAAHSGPERFVADRRRQNALALAGWTILRFTHPDLRDRPSWVVSEIRSALGLL